MIYYILAYLFALAFGGFLWYIYYGLECYLNGGFISGNHWTCFKQDLSLFFGGRKAKGDYIFGLMRDHDGWIDEWSYAEIREKNLYEEVGVKVLPGPIHFIGTHIFLPLSPSLLVFFISLLLG